MSHQIVQEVLEYSQAKGHARILLVALAERADSSSREAWPGVDELARRAVVTRRTAQRDLRMLEHGLKEIATVRPAGRGRPTRYRILRYQVAPQIGHVAESEKAYGLTPFSDGKGVSPGPKGRQDGSERAYARTPEPSIEPSEEPRPRSISVEIDRPPGQGGDGPDQILLDETWAAVDRELREAATEVTHHIWLSQLELVGVDRRTLYVRAPEHVRPWVELRFRQLLDRAVLQALGRPLAVELVKPQPLIDEAAQAQGRRRRRRSPAREGVPR